MRLKVAIVKSAKALWKALPLIAGMVLLAGLFAAAVPHSFYTAVFGKSALSDLLVGSLTGSISAGTPITSYIIGGELLNQGVGLLAVTAFLVSWVTVGFVQLPVELRMLGKRFAIARNISAFALSFLVAIVTILIMGVL